MTDPTITPAQPLPFNEWITRKGTTVPGPDEYRDYVDYANTELLRNGLYDDQLAAEIEQEVANLAAESGVTADPNDYLRARRPDQDFDLLTRRAIETGDDDMGNAVRTYQAVKGSRDIYDDEVEYQRKLEEARLAAEPFLDPERVNDARRAALDRGDLPFVVIDQGGDKPPLIQFGPAAADIQTDEDLAAAFDANPDLDRRFIGAVRQKIQPLPGFDAPAWALDRQMDFQAAAARTKVTDTERYRLMVRDIANGNTDAFDRTLADLSTDPAFASFTPDERRNFLMDMAKMQGQPEVDPQNVAASLRTLSTGQVHIPNNVMFNKDYFDQALQAVPEGQHARIKTIREAHMEAVAPEMFKVIAEFSTFTKDDPSDPFRTVFVDFYEQAKAAGKSNGEILDEWMSNPDNHSKFWTRARGLTMGVVSAVTDIPLSLAVLAGSEGALDILVENQRRKSARKQYVNLFGDKFGIGYDATNLIAPVGVDFTLAAAAGPTGGATAVILAAKTGAKAVVKSALRRSLSAETKTLLSQFTRKAAARQATRQGLDTVTTPISTSAVLTLAGRDFAQTVSRSATQATVLGTAFTRSAGSTYASLHATLSNERNADGTPRYTPEQVREIALGHGLTSGAITASVVGAFQFLGAAGVERLLSGGFTPAQARQIHARLKLNPEIAKQYGVSLESPEKMIESAVRNATTNFLRAGVEEGGEEFVDQMAQSVNEALATGERFDVVKATKDALYAGTLGFAMGAGMTGAQRLAGRPLGEDRLQLERRSTLLQLANKFDAHSPNTAAALRAAAAEPPPAPAQEDVPAPPAAGGPEQAPSDAGVAPAPEGQVTFPAEVLQGFEQEKQKIEAQIQALRQETGGTKGQVERRKRQITRLTGRMKQLDTLIKNFDQTIPLGANPPVDATRVPAKPAAETVAAPPTETLETTEPEASNEIPEVQKIETKGRARMAERILVRAGVDPESASVIATRIASEVDPDGQMDIENFRAAVLNSFDAMGGESDQNAQVYNENPASYSTDQYGRTPEQQAELARQLNQERRDQMLRANRQLAVQNRIDPETQDIANEVEQTLAEFPAPAGTPTESLPTDTPTSGDVGTPVQQELPGTEQPRQRTLSGMRDAVNRRLDQMEEDGTGDPTRLTALLGRIEAKMLRDNAEGADAVRERYTSTVPGQTVTADAPREVREVMEAEVRPVTLDDTTAEPVAKTGETQPVVPDLVENEDGTRSIAGRRITQTKSRNAATGEVSDRWMVQSPENAERELRGERQIGGDALYGSLEEAVEETRKEIQRDAANAASRAAREAEESAQAEKESRRKARLTAYTAGMTALARGKVEKALSVVKNLRSTSRRKDYVGPRFQVLEEQMSDGFAATVQDRNGKTVYRMEDPEGNGWDITKTEYDFATWASENPKQDETELPRNGEGVGADVQPDQQGQTANALGETRNDELGGRGERTGTVASGTEPPAGATRDAASVGELDISDIVEPPAPDEEIVANVAAAPAPELAIETPRIRNAVKRKLKAKGIDADGMTDVELAAQVTLGAATETAPTPSTTSLNEGQSDVDRILQNMKDPSDGPRSFVPTMKDSEFVAQFKKGFQWAKTQWGDKPYSQNEWERFDRNISRKIPQYISLRPGSVSRDYAFFKGAKAFGLKLNRLDYERQEATSTPAPLQPGDPITFTANIPGVMTPTQGVVDSIKPDGSIVARVGKTKYPNAQIVGDERQQPELAETGDEVEWVTGRGDKATSIVGPIRFGKAEVDWFGLKNVPLEDLKIIRKSNRRLAREKKEREQLVETPSQGPTSPPKEKAFSKKEIQSLNTAKAPEGWTVKDDRQGVILVDSKGVEWRMETNFKDRSITLTRGADSYTFRKDTPPDDGGKQQPAVSNTPVARVGRTKYPNAQIVETAPVAPTPEEVQVAIETTLSAKDKEVAAAELDASEWNADTATTFTRRMADWITSGIEASEKLAAMFARVAKAISKTAMALIAMVSITANTTTEANIQTIEVEEIAARPAGPSPSEIADVQRRAQGAADAAGRVAGSLRDAAVSAGQTIVNAVAPTVDRMMRQADFGKVKPSDNARKMADWIVKNQDNNGLVFTIADKSEGSLYFFSPEGKLIKKSPALFGSTPGDVHSPSRLSMTMEQIRNDRRQQITPAGRFETETARSNAYGQVVPIAKTGRNSRAAIHKVFTGRPQERRTERMDPQGAFKSDPLRTRVSLGCINVPDSTAKAAARMFEDGGVVYVMPDTEKGKSLFEGFAGLDAKFQPSVSNTPVARDLQRLGIQDGSAAFLRNVIERGPKEYRTIARILSAFTLPNPTLVDLPDANYAGAFVASTRQILINVARRGPRGPVDTVMHELIHAALEDSLRNPTDAQRKILNRLERIRQTVMKRAEALGNLEINYGLSSMDEFFTHFLTSPEFQRQIGAMTPKGQRNWVEVILDALRSLFGAKLKTEADKQIETIWNDMIRFTRSAAEEQTYGLSRMDQLRMQPADLRDLSRFKELSEMDSRTPEQEAELVRLQPAPQATDPFYSQLQRTVAAKVPARATPDQIMATVKAAGVKAEEIKWSGIEQALGSLAVDGKVEKAALMKYLGEEGSVRFEEVTLGEDATLREKALELAKEHGWKSLEEMDATTRRRYISRAAGLPISQTPQGEVKFGQYVIPGGENYREVVLAMPDAGDADAVFNVKSGDGRRIRQVGSRQEAEALVAREGGIIQRLDLTTASQKNYTSTHFPDVPNYVAHMRTNERDGGLFIEELQSDRHQAGRKKGYKEDRAVSAKQAALDSLTVSREDDGWVVVAPNGNRLFVESGVAPTEQSAREYAVARVAADVEEPILAMGGGIPDAPFRTTWPLALFKRALRDAVASGKDWIGWTPGSVHTDRWGTERIEWAKQTDGSFLINAKSQHGGNAGGIDLEGEADARNMNPQNSKTVTTEAQLVEAIRPSLTEGQNPEALGAKLWKRMQTEGSGVSMPRKEGFEGFYDNMLPKEIGKYVKQWGGKVEKSSVYTDGPKYAIIGDERGLATTARNMTEAKEAVEKSKERWPGENFTIEERGTPIWRIDITPEMRESILSEGQPLFQPVSEPTPAQTPDTLRETAIGFLPDGFTLDDLDINFDQLAEDVSDTDPVNAEELIRSAVNYEVARVAAERELGDDYDPMFAETYYKLLTGNLPDADKAFYIGNPNAMERLIRFLTSALRRLTTAIELQFDRHTATAVNRISRALVDAERGFRVRPNYVMMGGDVTRFLFAGENAQMDQFRRDSLDTARAMAAAGKTPEEIRAVTGWFPGQYDGKMRWEIPDKGATIVDQAAFSEKAVEVYGGEVFSSLSFRSVFDRIQNGKVLRLNDVLDHPDLYAAYPEAAEIPFFPIGGNIVNGSLRTIEGQKFITATFTTENGRISEQSRSVILHEVQHFIQDVEGFAKGGSPDGLISRADIEDAAKFKDAYNALNKYKQQLGSLVDSLANERSKKKGFMGFGGPDGGVIETLEAEVAKIQNAVNSVWEYQKKNLNIDKDSTRASLLSAINAVDNKLGSSWVMSNRNAGLDMLYKSLAGEIEARDVQARANMTPEQLAATAPYSSENIAPEDSIVRFQPILAPDNRISHFQDVYMDDPQTDADADTGEPRNWFQRMFVDKDDLPRPQSKLFLNRRFSQKALESTLKNNARDFKLIQKKTPADLDLVSRALPSNRPTLTKADTDRINAEFDARLADLWTQESAAIAARENTRDEQLKASRSTFLRAGKSDPGKLGTWQTEYEKRDRQINSKAKTDIAAISADYRVRREQAMEQRKLATVQARLARADEMRRESDLALEELEKVNPDMAQWVIGSRMLIDDAQSVVKSVYGDSPQLQMLIDATRGAYMVRTYRIHQDPGYAKKFLTDPKYRKAYSQLVNYFEDQLVEQEKENIRRMLGEGNFEITEEEITNSRVKNKAERLKRLSKGENYNDADIEAIARAEVQDQAKTIAEDWIMGHGDSQTLVPQGSSSSIKVDFTRFLEKKDLDPILLEALGEITDPLFNTTRTIESLATIAQNRKFLAAYVRTGTKRGNLISKEEYESNPSKYRGWDTLVGKDERNPAYAPLSGYYAPPEHILAFKAVVNQNRTVPTSTAGKAFDRINRTIMGAAGISLAVVVMGNPASAVRNIFGGSVLAARQGIVAAMTAPFTKEGRRSFRVVYEAVFDPVSRKVSADVLNEYIALGVILNGVSTNNLKEMYEKYGSDPDALMDKIQEFIAKGSLNAAEKFGKVREGTNTFFDYISKIWEFTETLYNVVVFENELGKLREARFGTEKQMKQEAADRMRMLLPSHSEQSQGVQGFTGTPTAAMVAPFIRFKTDMIRTAANTYQLAIKDLNSGNPVLAKYGRERLASAFTVDAILTASVPLLMQALMGIGDDEDKAIRSAMPGYAKNSNFIYYLDRSTGELTTWDLTYLLPTSFYMDPLVNMYRAVASGNAEEIPAIAAQTVGQEFLGENVLAGLVIDVKRNKDQTTGKSIYLDTDTDAEKIRKSLAHVVGGAYTPAVGKVLYRTYQAAIRDQESDQFFFSPVGQAMNLFLPVKPRAQFVQDMAYRSFSETRAKNAQLWQTMSASRSPRPMDSSEIADMYQARVDGTLRVWSEFYNHAKGFEKLGMTRSEILATARRAGLSSDRTRQVVTRGTTDRPVESAEALEKMRAIDPERVRVYLEQRDKTARNLNVTGK